MGMRVICFFMIVLLSTTTAVADWNPQLKIRKVLVEGEKGRYNVTIDVYASVPFPGYYVPFTTREVYSVSLVCVIDDDLMDMVMRMVTSPSDFQIPGRYEWDESKIITKTLSLEIKAKLSDGKHNVTCALFRAEYFPYITDPKELYKVPHDVYTFSVGLVITQTVVRETTNVITKTVTEVITKTETITRTETQTKTEIRNVTITEILERKILPFEELALLSASIASIVALAYIFGRRIRRVEE
ncbi:MAG: hypothetical protein QW506_04925 [Thermoproteota archaeon]